MKKTYEFPKAEKMAFDYSDAVVASGIKTCQHIFEVTDTPAQMIDGKCNSRYTGYDYWSGDRA